jgi:hypothetical protein
MSQSLRGGGYGCGGESGLGIGKTGMALYEQGKLKIEQGQRLQLPFF